ncbi:MAG: tyrosine-type recombinase/integrase [Planctomycetota bacterium]
MKTTSELVRKTWPKVRSVWRKGEKFFQVDARRTGTNGKQEHYATKEDALGRAAKIEAEFSDNGNQGLAMPAALRTMAFAGEQLLAPYKKTIYQAAEFFKAHLDAIKLKEQSALVPVLAKAWLDDKKSGKNKKLRAQTLRGIHEASTLLTKLFAGKRVLEVTTDDIRDYLDDLNVGLRRKFNLNSRFSQFFNWSIKKSHTTTNPCLAIEIHVGGKEVSIFTPAEALAFLKLCETQHKDLLLYHAISLFAGLRPEECQALKWENVHLEEQTITVLAETSKTKETRNVHIETTLLAWIEEHKPTKLTGFVTAQTNFKKRTLALHTDAGYRGNGLNADHPEWPQDVLRHSYGSYWLAKFKNRAQLAESMGNSLQIIKKHYKRVVSKSDCAEYWSIVPGYEGRGKMKSDMPSQAEIKKTRAKSIQRALNR